MKLRMTLTTLNIFIFLTLAFGSKELLAHEPLGGEELQSAHAACRQVIQDGGSRDDFHRCLSESGALPHRGGGPIKSQEKPVLSEAEREERRLAFEECRPLLPTPMAQGEGRPDPAQIQEGMLEFNRCMGSLGMPVPNAALGELPESIPTKLQSAKAGVEASGWSY